jgi:hypothetical protein
MTVVGVASVLANDVRMRLEDADDLLRGGHRLAVQDAAFGLLDHPLHQWKEVVKLGGVHDGALASELLLGFSAALRLRSPPDGTAEATWWAPSN